MSNARGAGSRPSAGIRRAVALVAAAIVLPVSTAVGFAASTVYASSGLTVVDLGTLPYPFNSSSQALIVNDRGQVAGISLSGAGGEHAFFWSVDHGMVDLGALGGSFSYPTAMNDNGQVVGVAARPTGWHAFSWTATGGMIDLGTLGGTYSGAFAVNSAGVVVGYAELGGDTRTHAFAWTVRTGMVDLGTPGGDFSEAFWVSDNGQIVGQGSTSGNTASHAFRWTLGAGMLDLGTLGGVFSSAPGCCLLPSHPAVNNRGQVVGLSAIRIGSAPYHAFSWTVRGGMVDLGTVPGGLYSSAIALNAQGRVVGWSGSPFTHAFTWTAQSGIVDLGTLGGTYGIAYAVNNLNEIVGQSTIRGDGENHGFLWTPASGMTDLGTLGGAHSQASWVSEDGEIAGWADIPGGSGHAVVWVSASA